MIFKIPSLSSVLFPFLLTFLLDKCLLNICHVSGRLVGSGDAAEKEETHLCTVLWALPTGGGSRQIYDMLGGSSGH